MSRDSHWLLVLILLAGLFFPSSYAEAALATASAQKSALKCQKLIAQVTAKTVATRLKALDACGTAALACVQSKRDDTGCSTRAAAICEKQLHGASEAADEAAHKITTAKSCTELTSRDLLSSDGLGLGAVVGRCTTMNLSVCDGIEPLARCLIQTHVLTSDVLYDLSRPRTGELLAALPTSLPLTTGLQLHEGSCGTCGAPAAQRKAVEQCGKTLTKATQGLVAKLQGSIDKCGLVLLDCDQTKQNDSACFAKGTRSCEKESAKLEQATAKFQALVAKGCVAKTASFDDLAAPAGLNLEALDDPCGELGLSPPSSPAALAACLAEHARCQAASLAGQAVPRTTEFAAAGQFGELTETLIRPCPSERSKIVAGRAVFGQLVKFLKGVKRGAFPGVRKEGGRPDPRQGAGRNVTHVTGPGRVAFGEITKLRFRYGTGGWQRSRSELAAAEEPLTLIVGVQRDDLTLDEHFEVPLDPVPPGALEMETEIELDPAKGIDGCAFNVILATRVGAGAVVSDYTPVLLVVDPPAVASSGGPERMDLGIGGAQSAGGTTGTVAVSAKGRFVAFDDVADDLLGPGGDLNGKTDVFVRDRCVADDVPISGCVPSTERVDVGPGGVEADSGIYNFGISMSANGRFVAFSSISTNLLGAGQDTNARSDVFVRDRCVTDDGAVPGCVPSMERVSIPFGGGESSAQSTVSRGAALSADGRFVVFASAGSAFVGPGIDTGRDDVFVHDRCLSDGVPVPGCTPHNDRVSVGPGGLQSNGDSGGATISLDGRFVTFLSRATNLIGPVADTNGQIHDVFVHDRCLAAGTPIPGCTPTTERVSVGPGGIEADLGPGDDDLHSDPPSVSADGRFVAFESPATTLLGAGVDTNGKADVFLRDRCVALGVPVPGCTPATERISVGPANLQGDGDSGVFVAFLRSGNLSLSSDGRFVVFGSNATNLLGAGVDTNARTDIFVRDRCVADGAVVPACVPALERVTLGPGKVAANSASLSNAISSTGRYVGFWSSASNLLAPGLDTNGQPDVFLVDRGS